MERYGPVIGACVVLGGVIIVVTAVLASVH
jgi:hypothetical protein